MIHWARNREWWGVGKVTNLEGLVVYTGSHFWQRGESTKQTFPSRQNLSQYLLKWIGVTLRFSWRRRKVPLILWGLSRSCFSLSKLRDWRFGSRRTNIGFDREFCLHYLNTTPGVSFYILHFGNKYLKSRIFRIKTALGRLF